MNLSATEIKTFLDCERKWKFYSKNAMGLELVNKPEYLTQGSIFHEAMAAMYAGTEYQFPDNANQEIINLVNNYYDYVYTKDKEVYDTLATEWRFEYPVNKIGDSLIGFIDLILQEKSSGVVYGVEHKTARVLRSGAYNAVDIQLRIYDLMLRQYCQTRKLEYGGIYLNQIQKTKRFHHDRQLFKYTNQDYCAFRKQFMEVVKKILNFASNPRLCFPSGNNFNCGMCEFKEICMSMGFREVTPDYITQKFSDFQKRT